VPPGRTRTAGATLTHVLGDLVHPSRAAVPTSAFLAAMAEMDHEAAATRQALLRARNSGWLDPERRGRETWWSITPRAHQLIADGLRRIASLGDADDVWDGRWVVVVTTIPHDRRAVRDRVYRYLSWSGFGMPVPGLWVSPHVRNEAGAEFAIHHFGLEGASASFIGTAATIGMTEAEMVAAAWNLHGLDAHYDELVERHAGVAPSSGSQALRALLTLDADLRALPLLDPQLPAELTAERSGRRAAGQLLDLRAAWLDQVRPHWAALCG
jgi:phenylacetic acid degradation operon negative regulatory protein